MRSTAKSQLRNAFVLFRRCLLVTAFFEYYITNNADYLPYLQSSYAEYLSEEPFPFYMIGDSSVEALEQAIENFIVEEGLEDEERYMKLAGDGRVSE